MEIGLEKVAQTLWKWFEFNIMKAILDKYDLLANIEKEMCQMAIKQLPTANYKKW